MQLKEFNAHGFHWYLGTILKNITSESHRALVRVHQNLTTQEMIDQWSILNVEDVPL